MRMFCNYYGPSLTLLTLDASKLVVALYQSTPLTNFDLSLSAVSVKVFSRDMLLTGESLLGATMQYEFCSICVSICQRCRINLAGYTNIDFICPNPKCDPE